MLHVITLMAARDGGLDAAMVVTAAAALRAVDAKPGEPRWLALGHACDLPFEGVPAESAEAAVRLALAGAPIDLGAQPASGRRKSLLLADMESTVIAEELLDELGRLAGLGERIAAITQRAMRGEIDFADALRHRVALLAGWPAGLIEEARRHITVTAGARELVQTMRQHGARAVLVSGGFDCFAEDVARRCGFDEVRANRLEIADGRLTGRVAEPVLDRGAKLAALQESAGGLGLALTETAAIGDGANDLPMIQAAGLGVAFRGKPAVVAAARFRLDHCDLTGLLYLQGYRRDEFRS